MTLRPSSWSTPDSSGRDSPYAKKGKSVIWMIAPEGAIGSSGSHLPTVGPAVISSVRNWSTLSAVTRVVSIGMKVSTGSPAAAATAASTAF